MEYLHILDLAKGMNKRIDRDNEPTKDIQE